MPVPREKSLSPRQVPNSPTDSNPPPQWRPKSSGKLVNPFQSKQPHNKIHSPSPKSPTTHPRDITTNPTIVVTDTCDPVNAYEPQTKQLNHSDEHSSTPLQNSLQKVRFGPKPTSVSVPHTPLLQSSPVIRSKSLISRRTSLESISNLNKFTQNYIIPVAKWAYSPMAKKKAKQFVPYVIEYSVFKPVKNLPPIESEKQFILLWKTIVETSTGQSFDFPENHISPAEFNKLLDSIINIIEVEDVRPVRVAQGSSGSYFVLSRKRNSTAPNALYKVGIFKPKDEEPYGPLSPKWSKWLHRTLFPFFFGRSCLIPNLGYISEAAASVLDRQLLSYIVPYTDIIYLRSPSFYYSYFDRNKDRHKLPLKIGSFQMFLNGYTTASDWLKLYPVPADPNSLPMYLDITVDLKDEDLDSKFTWSKHSLEQFREELEKLVILDYIMRNTDRGLDNWMIKINWKLIDKTDKLKYRPIIKIGAIDSGLSFPWKRPDEWRSFPFGWLFLPLSMIGHPFSRNTRNNYLPLLTSKFWWEETISKLRKVFEQDNDFKERLWLQQVAVLKGQAFNVVEILKLSYAGPLELVRREDLYVWDDILNIPNLINLNEIAVEWNTSNYASDETTPLINSSGSSSRLKAISEDENTDEEVSGVNEQISGFDYTMTHEYDPEAHEGSSQVVIERLEKVNSKPPVFTWC